ncbi:MAG TPA: sulfurtransferase TusA family protein [Thermoplasmata archaeon]|nr:sulfurtransferase TusA family protein [Thermoplasmata archaeon]
MEVEGCPVPDELLYDLENDLWVRPEDGGATWTIGVTASLAAFAGVFVSVRFRPVGPSVLRGQSLATVESYRFTGPVRSPADAEILSRNEGVVQRPKLVNDAPYREGWLVRVRPTDPAGARGQLRTAAEVAELMRQRIRELKIRCYPAVPDAEMYEIGIECSAILAKLDDEIARRQPGEVVLLITDDPTSPIEMARWTDRTGHAVLHHRREGPLHHFLVRREPHPVPRRRPEARPVPPA